MAPSTLGSGAVIGSILIPKIGMWQTIYEGATQAEFANGVGWWPGTAMPGQEGNVVLGGHRTTSPKPFRNIDQLKPGDEIFISTVDGLFAYVVRETFVVNPDAIWIVDETPTPTLTMFACHPVGTEDQRIVVRSEFSRVVVPDILPNMPVTGVDTNEIKWFAIAFMSTGLLVALITKRMRVAK
jgi:sortase A